MQRAFKAGDLIFLGVAVTLMIALTLISYLIAPPRAFELRGSSYSAGDEGAKAVFLLLKELGYTVERSYEPIAALHATPSDTILVLASPARRASLQDMRALRRFIEQGGHVIATGGGGSFLPEMGSVTLLELPTFVQQAMEQQRAAQAGKPTGAGLAATQPTTYYAATPSPVTRNVPEVQIAPEILEAAPTPASYIPIYADHDGPGVLAGSFGDGGAIWMIGATPFLNAAIDKPGQLEFVLNLIGPLGDHRTVLWDEYYHGYDRGLLSYLGTTQLSVAFAQLALITLMALFTFSRRRGPLRPLLVRPRASAMEFVDAVSALYQKARAGSGAVETMRARLRRVLVTVSQMPSNSSDALLAAAAATRHSLDERELRELLADSETASHDVDLPADRALSLVRRMQAVVRTILARKTLD